MNAFRPTLNPALLDALYAEDDEEPVTEPRPEFQQAWADLMNDYPEREKWLVTRT